MNTYYLMTGNLKICELLLVKQGATDFIIKVDRFFFLSVKILLKC